MFSAARVVEPITAGLQWRAVRLPVCVTGTAGQQDLEACRELGVLLADEACRGLVTVCARSPGVMADRGEKAGGRPVDVS
jgi:hypothetical protein